MKSSLLALCLILLLVACSTPPLETSIAPPPQESSSVPSPSSVLSTPEKDYFITEEELGILDSKPVEELYRYLWGNLTPKQYCQILADSTNYRYRVLLIAPDKGVVEALLEDYTGPWAPVLYRHIPYTLADMVQAEADMWDFIKSHPGTPDVDIVVGEEWVEVTDQSNDPNADYSGLRSFAENYPFPDIYLILDYDDTHPTNPD